MRQSLILLLVPLSLLTVACEPTGDTAPTPDSEGDADTDTDSDADTDSASSCRADSSPSVGVWTSSFEPQSDCACTSSDSSCHSLYQGRAEAIDGNLATLSFQKVTGEPPSVDVSYWIVVGEDAEPSCTDLPAFVERGTGTWAASDATLSVSDIPIWPSEADLAAASTGETKKLFIITGGSDGPDSRTWFQKEAVVFTKECP